jgi:hypothetical protein
MEGAEPQNICMKKTCYEYELDVGCPNHNSQHHMLVNLMRPRYIRLGLHPYGCQSIEGAENNI